MTKLKRYISKLIRPVKYIYYSIIIHQKTLTGESKFVKNPKYYNTVHSHEVRKNNGPF